MWKRWFWISWNYGGATTCGSVQATQGTRRQLRTESGKFAHMHKRKEQVPRQAPGYLHIPGEIENVMLGRRLQLHLRPVSSEIPPFRSLHCRRHQQEQLVAALRIGSRHRGQLQAPVPTPLGGGGASRRAAAFQVHGSGVRARGSDSEMRQQKQQRRRPQEPEPPHESPPQERLAETGRSLGKDFTGRSTVSESAPGGSQRGDDDGVTGRRLRRGVRREGGVCAKRNSGFRSGAMRGRALRKGICDW